MNEKKIRKQIMQRDNKNTINIYVDRPSISSTICSYLYENKDSGK